MKIEISNGEAQLIGEALECYVREPAMSGGMMGVLGAIAGRAEETKFQSMLVDHKRKEEAETSRRQRVATLLRAKIYQAEAANSEHDLTDGPTPPPHELSNQP